MMAFVRKAFAGLLIGAGCVLPGVSGGVMAVSFGLYRPMLDALLGFFTDVKGNARFLAPLAVGGALGFFLGAVALSSLMTRYETVMLWLFIGFILGGVPGVVRRANENGFRVRYLLALAFGLAASLSLALMKGSGADVSSLTLPQALAAGGIQGFSTVVPGVSGSFLLIFLGWYQAYLQAVSSLSLGTLLPVGAGFALVALSCMRAVKWLFDRVPAYAYYGVLGFLLGTTALIVPPIGAGLALLSQALALVLGVLGAVWMGRVEAGE